MIDRIHKEKLEQKVRVRFAPSPTGAPHVGNIRTALFTWLFARHHDGQFILRIEDTDQDRAVEGSVAIILDSLKWLGLDVDEGPYFQSERLAIYKKHALELVDKKHAYYCFCSESRLKELRAQQEAQKQPPRYDRHCLSLSSDQVKQKLDSQEPHVVRMKIPSAGETVFTDIIKGEVRFKNSTIDDQVLLKSDGWPTYHLASVVDDHLMEISHVTRGEDWLPSTPKHIMLYDYFGWEKPHFAHVPVILGPDKGKLSKRHGAVSLLEYRDQGYLPEAMFNYLVLLGWNPKTNQEIFSREELIKEFDLDKVNKANPIFDVKKLNWMNGEYIKKMDLEKLADSILSLRAKPAGVAKQSYNRDEDNLKAVRMAQERMEKLTDFESLTSFLFKDPLAYDSSILVPKGLDQTQCQTQLQTSLDVIEKIKTGDWEEANLRKTFLDYCELNNIKKGDILWPLRVAVTGLKNSPDVFTVMDILGKDKTSDRIKQAIEKL